MNTAPLPKEIKDRLYKDTYEFGQLRLETGYPTTITGQKDAYFKGASKEAQRAQTLVGALEKIGTKARSLATLNWVDINTIASDALNLYNKQP